MRGHKWTDILVDILLKQLLVFIGSGYCQSMKVTLISLYISGKVFLAPTGAQGVTLSVRLSVCLSVR